MFLILESIILIIILISFIYLKNTETLSLRKEIQILGDKLLNTETQQLIKLHSEIKVLQGRVYTVLSEISRIK